MTRDFRHIVPGQVPMPGETCLTLADWRAVEQIMLGVHDRVINVDAPDPILARFYQDLHAGIWTDWRAGREAMPHAQKRVRPLICIALDAAEAAFVRRALDAGVESAVLTAQHAAEAATIYAAWKSEITGDPIAPVPEAPHRDRLGDYDG